MGHFNKVIHTLKPFYYYRIGRNDVPEATRLNTLLSTVHARRAGFSRDRASWHLGTWDVADNTVPWEWTS